MTPPTTPPALLLVGHGTRDEAGAAAFRSFVAELGRRNPGLPVGGGFIELSPPPLADAVADLVERQGVRRFAAVPMVLVSAGHAKGDIPAALAREHNDANTIAMGARLIGPDMAKACVTAFLETEFGGGRHGPRVDKLSNPPQD